MNIHAIAIKDLSTVNVFVPTYPITSAGGGNEHDEETDTYHVITTNRDLNQQGYAEAYWFVIGFLAGCKKD